MTSTSKTILITGSTDGIGKETALELAAMGHKVIVHGRSSQRAEDAANDIRKKSGNATIETVVADFTSLRQVRAMAADVIKRFPRLDVLINNAGVYMKERTLTEDGYETTFQVNHLAHFLLTHLLLDLLKQSAPSRIINVSSMAHNNAKLSFDNLQGEKRYGGYGAYACSKLENILFTYELAERLEGTGVTVNCLHPGVIATKLLRAGFGGFGGSGVKKGAETIVFLATSPKGATVTGKYFVNKEVADSSLASHDRSLRKALWELSERLVGIS
ncbi:MAG TPA: SDR family oxidoreductase [Bacteroidota bacterium]|nr:SDR family oxidoreductase [Bacteroidota bacterium]